MNIDFPTVRPYVAVVRRIIDGDTLVLDMDHGLHYWEQGRKLRLAGCNAWDTLTAADGATPEQIATSKEARDAAKANLERVLPVGTIVYVHTVKDYVHGGEYAARVFLTDGTDVVAMLIEQQWLAPWDARGSRFDHVPPWPRTVA